MINREIPPPLPPSRFFNRVAWITIIIVVLGALALASQPLYHSLKRWRARRFASQSEQFVAHQQWEDAFRKAQAAYQLSPQDPQVLRIVARLYSKLGQEQALLFWKQLFAQQSPSPQDHKEVADLALRLRQLDLAESHLAPLLTSTPNDPEVLQLASQLALYQGNFTNAVQLAERAVLSDTNSLSAQLFLAKILILSPNTEDQSRAKQTLLKLSETNDRPGLQSLSLAAQLPQLTPDEIEHLIARLRSHPLAGVEEQLLAADLEIKSHNTPPDSLATQLLKAHPDATSPQKLAMARWLNRHRLQNQALDLIPAPMAQTNSDLFLVRADALAALHQWPALKSIVEKENAPLDPPLRELYLARISNELGQPEEAAAHWKRLEKLEDNLKPPTLVYIAQYAEQIGERSAAINAYQRLTQTPGLARDAYLALIRLGEQDKNTARLRDTMREMTARYPDDPAPKNDLAYLNLLLGENIEMAKQTSQALFQKDQTRLAYRTTLALAYLRLDAPEEAKKLYDGLDLNWSTLLPGWQAVHASVYGACGATNLARTLARQIPIAALKPEEKVLIQPYL